MKAKPLALLKRLALLCGLGLALGYSWMPPQVSAPNERTRLYLAMALVDRQAITIDEEVKAYGRVFDLSKREGHFYTDKAPGSSFLVTPWVAAHRQLSAPIEGKTSIESLNDFVRRWFMVPLTLILLALCHQSMTLLGTTPRVRLQVTLALALGTPLFHYGAAFYGHAIVLCFAALSCWAWLKSARHEGEEDAPVRLAWLALSSFGAAMCFFVEYQGAALCLAFALGVLADKRRWRPKPLLAAALGALLPVAATLAYNQAAFGGPLTTSYQFLAHASSVEAHDKGLFGIMAPTWESTLGLLLSPSRGLVWCAPLALLGWAGLKPLWRSDRGLAIFALVSMALVTLITLGFHVPFWGFGQRLLVPILGFAALGAALLLTRLDDQLPALSMALKAALALAILYNVLVSSAFPEFPAEITAPLHSVALALIEQQSVTTNLGGLTIQHRSATGLLPLYAIALSSAAAMGWPPQGWPVKRWWRGFVAATLTFVLLAGVLWSYPERHDPRKLEAWQRWAMNLRWHITR